MRENVDVAIIGGGPGGSTLAALLASRGLSVALIERDDLPRDKVCGEFLSYDAMPVLDLLGLTERLDREGAPSIGRCRIVARDRTYEFPFPAKARGVSRMLLDELLFRCAAERGADPHEGWTAEDLGAESVTITRRDERRSIQAKVVVGAWGRWGRFDTQLGRAFVRERSNRSFGFKRHYFPLQLAAADQNRIDLYSFDRGYLGVNGIEGNVTNICGLVNGSRLAGHRGRWESFIGTICSEEPPIDALYARHRPAQKTYLTSEPVIFRAKSCVERGIFMIGDASGVIDPLTGNGMAIAIQSALLVAPLLVELVADPSRRASIERRYRRQHRAMFGSRLAWAHRTAAVLSRPRLLEKALRIVRSPKAGEFLLRKTRAENGVVEGMVEEWTRCTWR